MRREEAIGLLQQASDGDRRHGVRALYLFGSTRRR